MNTKTETQPTTVEPDSYVLSKRLHDKGVNLATVAARMLGYKAVIAFDENYAQDTGEAYLISPYGDGSISVTTDKNGLQVAHTPFGMHGRYLFNMVDFVLAHGDQHVTPVAAAKAISQSVLNAELQGLTERVAVVVVPEPEVVKPVVPRELDVTYAMSKNLQDQNVPLTRVAAEMFGFNVLKSGPEAYIFNNDDFVASVVSNSEGLQIAHYVDPVDGRSQVCSVRFAMQHGSYKSPLHAQDAIKARFVPTNKAPQAA